VRTRKGLTAKQQSLGSLSFATDAWTSPNHRAYVAFTVHLKQDGIPFSLLLDFVELPRSHSGINLAIAFAQVLKEFGITDKVSPFLYSKRLNKLTMETDFECNMRQRFQ
jgi:hypothetical protein